MTKITIQLLEKGTDSFKSKLDTLTQDFQALKMRLEKEEPIGRTSQDSGGSWQRRDFKLLLNPKFWTWETIGHCTRFNVMLLETNKGLKMKMTLSFQGKTSVTNK